MDGDVLWSTVLAGVFAGSTTDKFCDGCVFPVWSAVTDSGEDRVPGKGVVLASPAWKIPARYIKLSNKWTATS